MDPNARAWRNRRGLSESRAAAQQRQDSNDRNDSTDFHGNVPSFNRIRRHALVLETNVSGETCELRLEALEQIRATRRIVGGAPIRLTSVRPSPGLRTDDPTGCRKSRHEAWEPN